MKVQVNRLTFFTNLHSNMDRLKPAASFLKRELNEHLHSNMDRLKQSPERANIPNNNSSFY